MNDKECPAEPVVGDEGAGQGGFAKVAEHLNRLYPNRPRLISRQLVHKWWMHRHFNGFPAAIESTGSPGTSGGRGRPVFDIAAVEAWHTHYLQTRHRGAPWTPVQEHAQRASTAGSPKGDDSLAA